VFFEDSFGGTAVDTSKWDVFLPYDSSSIEIMNGSLQSVNRGQIITKQEINAPCIISGKFTTSYVDDLIEICIRSSGDNLGQAQYGALDGLAIDFWMAGFVSFGKNGIMEIADSREAYNFNPNQIYSFKIIDTGNSVSVEINNALVKSIDTSYSTGSKIGIYSSQAGGVVLFSDIKVSGVPEPSALSLLAVGLGGLAIVRRRRS